MSTIDNMLEDLQPGLADVKALQAAYQRLFATRDGQIVLEDLRRFAGYVPQFDQAELDDVANCVPRTFHNLGKERVVKRIEQMRSAGVASIPQPERADEVDGAPASRTD